MAGKKKNKDHLNERSTLELVEMPLVTPSDDPLVFWSNHRTENHQIDLRVFVEGQYKRSGCGSWNGAFSGRPKIIQELAPVLKRRVILKSISTCRGYIQALRNAWRMLDLLETIPGPDSRMLPRLESVADLNELHGIGARLHMESGAMTAFMSIADEARQGMGLSKLGWAVPSTDEVVKKVIPDDQAKALKMALKLDWQNVRRQWKRNDEIMSGVRPKPLSEQHTEQELKEHEEDVFLRNNWLYLEKIQQKTGRPLPTPEQIRDGLAKDALNYRGLYLSRMRPIAFPTKEEADVAFHCACLGSGWNPSTLIKGLDATRPDLIFPHPKDTHQSVLTVGEEEVAMQGSKARAGGRMQFCLGLQKNSWSPPNIVAAYLARTEGLREQLAVEIANTKVDLNRLKAAGESEALINKQIMQIQRMQAGLRNVWLYVDKSGDIAWISGCSWIRYARNGRKKSYLGFVIDRINKERNAAGANPENPDELIPYLTPGDFRDIYLRWVLKVTGGNVIAVMINASHARLSSSNSYINTNLNNAESDRTIRRFMTHLVEQMAAGRIDTTILAQLVRSGPLSPEMETRLAEYRRLMKSRINVGCAQPRNPPVHIEPDHAEGKFCGTHLCLRNCPNARFLPESIDGIAMRVEELVVMSERLPLETWMRGDFATELETGLFVLSTSFKQDEVETHRSHWRKQILEGRHVVPGSGLLKHGELN